MDLGSSPTIVNHLFVTILGALLLSFGAAAIFTFCGSCLSLLPATDSCGPFYSSGIDVHFGGFLSKHYP